MRTTVYFATNRLVAGKGLQVSDYGDEIVSPSDPSQVTCATAFVDGTDLATDTSGRIVEIQGVSQGSFSAAAMGDLGQTKRNILVFLHGFDNSFEDAIARAAYNREWMAASGVVSADMAVVAFSCNTVQLGGFPDRRTPRHRRLIHCHRTPNSAN